MVGFSNEHPIRQLTFTKSSVNYRLFFADSSVSCGPSDYEWHDQLSTHLSLDAVIAEPSFVFNESYLLALDRQSRPQPSLNGQKMMLGTYESLLGRHSSSQVTLYASASFIEPED